MHRILPAKAKKMPPCLLTSLILFSLSDLIYLHLTSFLMLEGWFLRSSWNSGVTTWGRKEGEDWFFPYYVIFSSGLV